MGRARKIDPDHLLDIAENIVLEGGASALTIENVAKAAGVTNGGVQYSFRTKDALITAMFDRWGARYREAAGSAERPGDIGSYTAAMFNSEPVARMKAASLMAALTRAPEFLGPAQDWYEGIAAGAQGAERLAFLAAEGAFLLRYLGLMKFSTEQWDQLGSDIKTLITSRQAVPQEK